MQGGSSPMRGRRDEDVAGIGIFLAPNRKGQFMITKIAPDGAAFQSKEIEVGDLLVQVNGTVLEGMQIDEVRQYITGPPNSRIELQLLRPIFDQTTGVEELNAVFVSLKRSASIAHGAERDLSPNRFEGPAIFPANLTSFNPSKPVVGQAFAQYTPVKSTQDAQQQRRAPALLQAQNQNFRTQSPSRGPGPLYSGGERSAAGGINSNGILTDPSRIYGSPSQQRPTPNGGIYGNDPQYSTVRRSISAPEPRRSWPATGGENWDQGAARNMTPQHPSQSPSRKRGLSPGAPGIGLFGIGIVLQNDVNSDLRVIDITAGGPADTQGCPFLPGDIVVSLDGQVVRGLSALQAREIVLGRHGTPIEVKVLRPIVPRGTTQTVFQNLSCILFRGVHQSGSVQAAPVQAAVRASSARNSARTPSPSPFRVPPSPRTGPAPRSVAVNEHMCGVGVFLERVGGSLVVKNINPQGPAGKVPPTYLFPGDYLVAIDGQHTQNMTMKEVRDKIIGPRGTLVTLALRRFMPSTGEFSHVFETRIQRELPPKSMNLEPRSGAQQPRGPLISNNDATAHGKLDDASDPPRDIPGTEIVCNIGLQLMQLDDVLMVKSLEPGSPADRCGLISRGDILHRIDYEAVDRLTVEQVESLLGGPARSSVVLGMVKMRHRLRVNVRLAREKKQSRLTETPARERPLARSNPSLPAPALIDPGRMDYLRATMATPQRLGYVQPMMQLGGGMGLMERSRRPTPMYEGPMMMGGMPFHPMMLPFL